MAGPGVSGEVSARFRELLRLPRRVVVAMATIGVVGGGTVLGACPAVDWLIGKVYQNVVSPEDTEMAVTVTSYPSSSNVASILGGSGEGLNCSIPRIAKMFFPRSIVPNERTTATHLFRQACVFHDLCYRHGLATYGYTQNDCDQMLQEHAARICTNVGGEACQLNAKKVLAGVSNGGFGSYQSWSTSTYYEFDPMPAASEQMTVARVVDHPFKAVAPEAAHQDPDQLLLTFDITRSNTTVACRNCADRTFSPDELRAAGLLEPKRAVLADASGSVTAAQTADMSEQAVQKALADLARSRFKQPRPVGLPSTGIHAAPRLLKADNGEQFVVWVNRRKPEKTGSCVIIADAKNLLTQTRSRDLRCDPGDNPRMLLAKADMQASSPQPELVTKSGSDGGQEIGLIGTGLSMGAGLQICLSPDLQSASSHKGNSTCYPLHSPDGSAIVPELGAFQNFPIIKGERHIYLTRRAYDAPDRKELAGAGQALVFDVGRDLVPSENSAPTPIKLRSAPKFDISDDYDPMLPLTKDADLRLLSVRKSNDKMRLYEIDLDAEKPAPVPIGMRLGASGAKVDLHASWARRPIVVLDQPADFGGPAKTQLVLSRSLVTTTEETKETHDSVRVEFLVLERDKSASGAADLKQVRGLACNVTYSLQGADTSRPCRRSSYLAGDKRPSPAHKLQGGQLLVGRLTAPGQKDADLALTDACYPKDPIILHPTGINLPMAHGFQPVPNLRVPRAEQDKPMREIECGPLSDPIQIAQAMPAPQ